MGKQGGIVFDYTMANDVKCHELTDVARKLSKQLINQRANGQVNARLISGPSISTKHTKPI